MDSDPRPRRLPHAALGRGSTINSLTRLDKYIALLVALAWVANVIAVVMLWGKGNPRALQKSLITVAGSSCLLLYYLLLVLQPHLRESTFLRVLQAVGWVTMLFGFLYFWVYPIYINFRYR